MFTGLIETTGSIASVQAGEGATRLLIQAPALTGRWREGDSIAVSGVCLTAIPTDDPQLFAADLAQETLQRTTLGDAVAGRTVNLELPTPAGAPLGGHVVQGHVDGIGTLLSLLPLGPNPDTADWRLTLELPSALATQVIQQGSITINGISLTIARLHDPMPDGARQLEIAVIPHTWRTTNLHTLKPGTRVNIETDVLAKYAQNANRRWAPLAEEVGEPWLTGAYLMANGY